MTLNFFDYPILYVDDEKPNLVTLQYALGTRFSILTASSGQEGLELLVQQPVAVLLCDQRMPGMTGVELCKRALELRPDVTRMLMTAYSDVEAVIAAINLGQVTRFLLKPWRSEELEQVLRSAIEIAHLRRTVRDLEARLVATGAQRVTLVASAAVVHELSNPLAAMTMAAAEASQTIARVLPGVRASAPAAISTDIEWLKELQDEVMAAVTQLNAMLRRMREGAKPESIAGQCELKVVTESAVRLVRRQIEPHARLVFTCDSTIDIGLDASVVAEIVINLLLSASHAIETCGLPGRTIRIEARDEGPRAVLTVADDGPGIAGKNDLFDARFSTHGDGRGLGLLVVYDLVRRAGGAIDVESEPGRGTRFDVRLPRVLAASPA